MLKLTRKGFWFWGDRLTFPVLTAILWAGSLPWFFKEQSLSALLAWSIVCLAVAWASFRYISQLRTIEVDNKNLTLTFANGRVRTVAKKDVERVGVKAVKTSPYWWGIANRIGFRDGEHSACVLMGKGQFLDKKPLSDHEAAARLAKELGMKEMDPKGKRWPTWEAR